MILNAIEQAGYKAGKDVYLAMDAAASEMWNKGKYDFYKSNLPSRAPAEMVELYKQMVRDFPIISMEDVMGEEDWEGWRLLTAELGDKIQLEDDVFVTNKDIKKGN
jgi:enolase